MVIPAHTQVQGVVEADKRPGHVNRISEFRFRFTTLIFPNNHVAPIRARCRVFLAQETSARATKTRH